MIADIFGVSVDYLIGHSDAQRGAAVMLTKEELRHIALWRTVPVQFRRDMDMLLEKYEFKAANRTNPLKSDK